MTTNEVNSNNEWLNVFSGVDFEGVEDCYTDDAAETFTSKLHDELMERGFETDTAKGQRSTCHGWNGANTFHRLIGPCGTFNELTEAEEKAVYDAIDAAEATMRKEWCTHE